MLLRRREHRVDRLSGELGRALVEIAGRDTSVARLEESRSAFETDIHSVRAAAGELASLNDSCLFANLGWRLLPRPRPIRIRQWDGMHQQPGIRMLGMLNDRSRLPGLGDRPPVEHDDV